MCSNTFCQTFNRLYDFSNNESDYINNISVSDSFILATSRFIGVGAGGYGISMHNRINGDVLWHNLNVKVDTIAEPNGISRVGPDTWIITGSLVPFDGEGGRYFSHIILEDGQTIQYQVNTELSEQTKLWDACKSSTGVLLTGNRYFASSGLEKTHLEFIRFNGEMVWRSFLFDSIWTSSTRCVCVEDTLILAMTERIPGSSRVTHIVKLDTVGFILDYSRITTITDMVVSDIILSADSTEILLGGYQSDIGIANAAIIKLDRGLNVKGSKLYTTGDRGLGRAIVQTSDDKFILIGHGADLDRFDNYDNAFVLRINRFNLLAEALYWYTPSGTQADGKVQIMTRAELDGGQLFVSGHGGIVDTSFSQDAWLLALNEDGTCDSASCYPWLFTGIEGLPLENLDAFKAWSSGDAINVSLTEASLVHAEARLVVMNAEGRKLTMEIPVTQTQQSIPTPGWSSGVYFVVYQSPKGKMLRRVWVP